MMSGIAGRTKELIRAGFRRAGLSLQYYTVETVSEARIHALLRHHGVDLVVDVGANAGQHGLMLRHAGYRGRIVSFEPLPDAWEDCSRHASKDPLWAMAPRTAVGATEGVVDLHVASNSVSSSILPMGDAHRAAAPASAYVGRATVPLSRLDVAARDFVEQAQHPFLKIDTQGYELEVLKGASGILDRFVGVQLEMSLTPLYEGSASLAELLHIMTGHGFEPHAILPGFTDMSSGRMLQADGLFFRSP